MSDCCKDYIRHKSMRDEAFSELAKERIISSELQHALEEIKQLGKTQIPCPDGIAGCAVYHGRYNAQSELAKSALSHLYFKRFGK